MTTRKPTSTGDEQKWPELYFGLVGPVGTDLQKLEDLLKKELREIGYVGVDIHLSRLFHELPKFKHLKKIKKGEDVRIIKHMEAGNTIRRTVQNGDAVIRLGINFIRNFRKLKNNDPQIPVPKHAYVLLICRDRLVQ